MSRVAKQPIELPSGVEVVVNGQEVTVKGANGEFKYEVHPLVSIEKVKPEDGGAEVIQLKAKDDSIKSKALSGTSRARVNNLVVGVSKGFEKKLTLVGVGYRVQVQGNTLNLTLGFSHPVKYELPVGVTAEAPDNTTIVLKSADKQKLGQAAAEIRAFRPPEPYKGKGIRYADEVIIRKETKKK